MSIVVTGGMGFIGSNIVKALNDIGREDIYVIDSPKNNSEKNIEGCKFKDIIVKEKCLESIQNSKFCDLGKIDVIFHEGAITDTTHPDEDEIMSTNYQLSVDIFRHCVSHDIRMIYASSAAVYGLGTEGFEVDPDCELPLNTYGQSNYDFDSGLQIVGLRYFNVYGPGECHKDNMASPINQFSRQAMRNGEIKVFEGSSKFNRDFIHIDDIVDVNMFFFRNPEKMGIYNCGSGETASFQDAADIVSSKTDSIINTIPFPKNLEGRYQANTKADIEMLRRVGYYTQFRKFSDAAAEYTDFLVG